MADKVMHLETEALGPMIARVEGSRNFAPNDTVYASPVEGREVLFR